MNLWSILIFFVSFFVIAYFLIPLIWKIWALRVNAAYRPSKLDRFAQPEFDQVQNCIPEVIVDAFGRYEINFGKGRRLSNGTLQIHYQNRWYSAHASQKNQSIKLISLEKSTSSDIFGTFERIFMKWELEGTAIRVHSSIYIYSNQPIIKFQLEFPLGLKDVATKKLHIPFFKFPSFNQEGPNQRVLAFRYGIFSPPMRSISQQSTQGPVVFYDNELNAAVLGPLDHFMIAFTGQEDMIFHGLEGQIKEIPPGYEHSTLLFFTQGINKAIVDWCDYLHKYHNKVPKDPYADPVLANLGFWTQNGAYYYYRKEKGMNCEQTITSACNIFQEKKIPIKYFQLDSWWYQKDMNAIWKYPPFKWIGKLIGGAAFGGTILWEAIPTEFPNGLKTLHEKINLPLACHSRWFSPKSPYLKKYKSIISKRAALPMEPAFWDTLMNQAAEWGLIMYEQDWLINTFSRISFLQEDVYAAENWLTWMAEAAHRHNISIQYCMAPSGAFLNALKFPAVTNVRVTGDYNARGTKQFYYPHFSQTNILAWGVGIWPSLDCYLTTKTPLKQGFYRELYPEQMTLLSNLGGGIICPGDRAERINRDLLIKTCTEEGLLLKPDRPITANDLMFKIHQKPYIMDTWTQRGGLFWRYIVVVNLWHYRVKDPKVTLQELGYPEKGVLYDFFTNELKEIGPEEEINLTLKRMGYKYFIFAPFIKEGVALIGAHEKFVTCSNKLIPHIQIDSANLSFTIQYSPNSTLKLLIYSKKPPQDIKLKDNSASVKWNYDLATHKLEITLAFSANNSNEVSVIFNE